MYFSQQNGGLESSMLIFLHKNIVLKYPENVWTNFAWALNNSQKFIAIN